MICFKSKNVLRLTEENKLKRFIEENEQNINFEREKKSKELEVNKNKLNLGLNKQIYFQLK